MEYTTSKNKIVTFDYPLEQFKVVNVKELSGSPNKTIRYPDPPLPEQEVEEENLEWLKTRPIRSSEKRKHYYLEAAKFKIEDFFNDRDDEAKLRALVQAPFVYD
jgi:hypothetical protein